MDWGVTGCLYGYAMLQIAWQSSAQPRCGWSAGLPAWGACQCVQLELLSLCGQAPPTRPHAGMVYRLAAWVAVQRHSASVQQGCGTVWCAAQRMNAAIELLWPTCWDECLAGVGRRWQVLAGVGRRGAGGSGWHALVVGMQVWRVRDCGSAVVECLG